jgi:hypothetical protein
VGYSREPVEDTAIREPAEDTAIREPVGYSNRGPVEDTAERACRGCAKRKNGYRDPSPTKAAGSGFQKTTHRKLRFGIQKKPATSYQVLSAKC